MKLLLFFGLSYDVFAETVPKASGREGIPVLTDKVGEEGALDGENNKENLPNEPSRVSGAEAPDKKGGPVLGDLQNMEIDFPSGKGGHTVREPIIAVESVGRAGEVEKVPVLEPLFAQALAGDVQAAEDLRKTSLENLVRFEKNHPDIQEVTGRLVQGIKRKDIMRIVNC